MGKKELFKELTEIRMVKIPAVEQMLNYARQNGDLSENAIYDGAMKEKGYLFSRMEELKIQLKETDPAKYKVYIEIGEEIDKCCDNFKLLDATLEKVMDFYTKFHNGEFYSFEEVALFYELMCLKRRANCENLNEAIDSSNYEISGKIFELEDKILCLTEEDGNRIINRLSEYWDFLGMAFHDEKDLFCDQFDSVAQIETNKKFDNVCRLIYSTAWYFIDKDNSGNKSFSHSELFIIFHLFNSFLSTPARGNALYLVLDRLLKEISYFDLIDDSGNYSIRIYDDNIYFRSIEQFKIKILLLQLHILDSGLDSEFYDLGDIEYINNANFEIFEKKYIKGK